MSNKQKTITCPNCGFHFSILYARAVSCQNCSKMFSSLSCEYVKCPKCGLEFHVPKSAAGAIEALKRWGLSSH